MRVSIIPRPMRLDALAGELHLGSPATVQWAADEALPAVDLLRAHMVLSTDALRPSSAEATIRFVLDTGPGLGPEGYRLSVDRSRVLIVAAERAGFLAAAQSLRQLLSPGAFSPVPLTGPLTVPCVEIEDAPRLSWRGAMLDVSRHFMPAPFLFRFVDLLALHKLNVLHLHLTDDQGWRFPSEQYPLLVEVGSWREGTRIGHQRDPAHDIPADDGTPHGGYYTRRELQALVDYAAARGVTVVPEIDLPGHAQAAIAAYPELGNVGPTTVRTQWGISPNVLNLSEETMGFCRTLWDEVLDVFPSRYVHIGGDECPRSEWRSPEVRRRIGELGLRDEDELQPWFTRQICGHLVAAGRRPVGWDEILEGGPLPSGTTVMSWRGEAGGVTAASAGFDVLMCPEQPTYFDHYQSRSPDEPLAIHGHNPLEAVYHWDPIPASLAAERQSHVLGTQFQLWSEYLPHEQDVEYMAFPRAAALAEVAWCKTRGDFAEFAERLTAHLTRLETAGVNYRPLEGPRPWQKGGSGARRRFDPPA